MARIDFAIGPESRVDITDVRSEGYPGRRHVWLSISGEGSPPDGRDQLTLHVGGYGVPTNDQVVDAADLLIDALIEVLDAARARIAESPEWDPRAAAA